jgi:uncharacterized pyridoxal phosphate-containing UPF0001 family protein
MTMAPKYAEIDEIREVFAKLYKIGVDIREKKYDNISMEYLSMGMSNDYKTAINCGSNMIRLGSCLFGKRNYQKEN